MAIVAEIGASEFNNAAVDRIMQSMDRLSAVGSKFNQQCFDTPLERLNNRFEKLFFGRFTEFQNQPLPFSFLNNTSEIAMLPQQQVAPPFAISPPIIEPVAAIEEKKTIYWIEYSERSRRVMLNGEKQLARLNFNSTNELVFDYLYRNQGRRMTVEELEAKALKESLNKTLHAIVRDLGFTGVLAQLFFDVSKSAIRFNNHITESDLEAFNLSINSDLLH